MLQRIGVIVGKAVQSRNRRLAVTIAFGSVVGLFDSVLNWYTTSLPLLAKYLMRGCITSGLAAIICWLVLEGIHERRRRVNEEVARAARLNHNIRNALEVITSAGYLVNDKVHGSAVASSVERIRRALKQEYPPER